MRIGVVGAGVIGGLRAQTVREHPDTTLAAVMDVSQAAADAATAGTQAAALTDLERFHDVDMDDSYPRLHADGSLSIAAQDRNY